MARKKMTFENAMESLEEIVNQLEDNNIPLNELTKKYNEGMKLSMFCLGELNKAEEVINTEVKINDEGKIVEQPLNLNIATTDTHREGDK